MLIMRHGECYLDYPNNPSLKPSGIEDVENIADWLSRNYRLKKIIHSSKRRAIETAELIRKRFPLIEVIESDLLNEISKNFDTSEQYRLDNAFRNVILPQIDDSSILIIGHMNSLTKISELYVDIMTESFENYGSLVEVSISCRIKNQYRLLKLDVDCGEINL